jgi:serine/threonine-protein phosphatase Stp1
MRLQKRTFSVHVDSWGASWEGNVRTENQDTFLNWADHTLWAVADGVGSSRHGGAASRMIAEFLMKTPAPLSLDTHISNVTQKLRLANDRLREQARATGATFASTAVVLLMHDASAACLWAGDSRCYLFRNGILYQCTKDHTLRQEKIDTGELTAPEARRMVRGNIITNAVGVQNDLRLEEVRFSLRAGDKFLLCSDGLFTIVPPATLSACLTRATAREAVETLAESLDGMHQPDNITFVTIFLSELT